VPPERSYLRWRKRRGSAGEPLHMHPVMRTADLVTRTRPVRDNLFEPNGPRAQLA